MYRRANPASPCRNSLDRNQPVCVLHELRVAAFREARHGMIKPRGFAQRNGEGTQKAPIQSTRCTKKKSEGRLFVLFVAPMCFLCSVPVPLCKADPRPSAVATFFRRSAAEKLVQENAFGCG